MNTTQKRTARSVAMSAALLTGTGLVAAAVPAQAVVTQAPTQTLRARSVSAPVIVYRSGVVSARASISAAPKLTISTKKVKRKHRSRRS